MKITIEFDVYWIVKCDELKITVSCDSIQEAAEFAVQLAEQIARR